MRTFLVHGSAVAGVGAIPRGQRDSLRELQDLYMRADPDSTVLEEETGRDESPQYQGEQSVTHVDPSSSVGLSNQTRSEYPFASNTRGGHSTDTSGIADRPAHTNQDTLHGCGGDSAIDVGTFGCNRSQCISAIVSPNHSNKHRRASQPERVALTNKRTSLSFKRPVWSWGPESTSLDKATWLPQMMRWDVQEVEAVHK